MTLYLKWTASGRVPSCQGGKPIPVGKWTRRITNPILCKRGWQMPGQMSLLADG